MKWKEGKKGEGGKLAGRAPYKSEWRISPRLSLHTTHKHTGLTDKEITLPHLSQPMRTGNQQNTKHNTQSTHEQRERDEHTQPRWRSNYMQHHRVSHSYSTHPRDRQTPQRVASHNIYDKEDSDTASDAQQCCVWLSCMHTSLHREFDTRLSSVVTIIPDSTLWRDSHGAEHNNKQHRRMGAPPHEFIHTCISPQRLVYIVHLIHSCQCTFHTYMQQSSAIGVWRDPFTRRLTLSFTHSTCDNNHLASAPTHKQEWSPLTTNSHRRKEKRARGSCVVCGDCAHGREQTKRNVSVWILSFQK